MVLNSQVEDRLYKLNPIEISQQKTGKIIFDYPNDAYITGKKKDLSFVKTFFLKNNHVYISKHNRFAEYPKHSHDFLEFNYMLNGHCNQIINDKLVKLSSGDLILLDNNSTHSIEKLSENDILINIIFPKDNFNIDILSELNSQKNILFHFLMQNISSHAAGGYVFFDVSKNLNIKSIIEQMINNYFEDTTFSNEILKTYIPILFMELIGNTEYYFSGEIQNTPTNETVIRCLKLIEEKYQTLTLSYLSKALSYNKTYLSNLLKDKLGKNFTELLNDERMKKAAILLESTSLPIVQISHKVGITNLNYFYKIFKQRYEDTPNIWRKNRFK